jgi:Phage tail baseplate hub (GPD)
MSVRQLTGIVTIGGLPCPVLSLDVDQTATSSADTMNAELSMAGVPGIEQIVASAPEIDVSAAVKAGADSGVLFTGTVDNISCDFDRRTVSISARDKTKGMAGKKSTEDFRNKTASQIVSEIAGRHGLSPAMDTTADMAGKKFNVDHVLLTNHVSEWTVVQHLADREGKVAFVQQDKLYFKELDDESFGLVTVIYVPPTDLNHAASNVLRLTGSRNMEAGKPSECHVRSWNVKKKKAYHGQDEGGGGGGGGGAFDGGRNSQGLGGAGGIVGGDRIGGGSGGGAKNVYEYSHPQLDQSQCDKMAKKRLRESRRQEMTIELEMVGSASVRPPKRLSLTGTLTAFDQLYFIDSVRHRIDEGGYTMSITAKNTKGGS